MRNDDADMDNMEMDQTVRVLELQRLHRDLATRGSMVWLNVSCVNWAGIGRRGTRDGSSIDFEIAFHSWG